MMPSASQFNSMLKMLKANPAIADNPQAQAYIQVLESGDSAKGEQLANNLLNTYGITREDALAQAKRLFRIP